MTQDATVKSALGHWAARFVANGVVLTDFEEVVGAVETWNDWCSAWSNKAGVHEALGRDALARKKFLSAGEHLQRAETLDGLFKNTPLGRIHLATAPGNLCPAPVGLEINGSGIHQRHFRIWM